MGLAAKPHPLLYKIQASVSITCNHQFSRLVRQGGSQVGEKSYFEKMRIEPREHRLAVAGFRFCKLSLEENLPVLHVTTS